MSTSPCTRLCRRSSFVRRFEADPEVAFSTPPRQGQETDASNKAQEDSTSHIMLERGLSRVFSEDYNDVDRRILDPRGPMIHIWNKILFAACLTSLFVDPLFFLLPQVKEEMCIQVPSTFKIGLTLIRSIADAFYFFNIYVQFRTAYVAPSSRVFGRGELVVDPKKIASRYLNKDFWLDLLAAQPIPQVLIWIVVPSLRSWALINTRNAVRLSIIAQFLLRLNRVFPLASKINKATGIVLQKAWAGAAYNLMLFILASHILGCLWYLLAIERQEDCWRKVCSLEHENCYYSFLDCSHADDPRRAAWFVSSNISSLCTLDSGFFEFGIYGDALNFGVTSTTFFKRFFYCLWWALRNMNCLGQELSTSTYTGEINYSMILAIVSLVLFALLIGNMQTYLQSNSARLEQWRVFIADTERWMNHRQLPYELKHNVRRYNQLKWCATRGVDEEAILKSLPMDLRRVIKRHLCLDLVRKVRLFEMMDEHMLDAVCERLRPCLFDQGTCLIREGDPVNEMLFIVRGRLHSYTTDGGRRDFYNSCLIGPGDFCGEELLTWALDPRSNSSITLPSSTRTVIAINDVEAFALAAEDLKFVASSFRRLKSKQLRQVFRFHSHQWRTWAACFIQAAWFRYKKRKELAKLKRMKSVPTGHGAEQTEAAASLQVASSFAMYVAKLAGSSRRSGPKPEEPDFSAEK